MSEQTDQPSPKRTNTIPDAIEAACRLANEGAIGSVRVISSRRPTYDELLHIRHCADDRRLDLIVGASTILLRPHRETPQVEEVAGTPAARPDWKQSAVAWLRVHGAMWRAELGAMSEGTR